MKKVKISLIFSAVVIFSLAVTSFSFALAQVVNKVDTSSGSNQNQVQSQEQNQGEEIMNQEKNQEGAICKSKCGDNFCDEVVCQAEGCPCAENNKNCPKDCPNTANQNTSANNNQNNNQNEVDKTTIRTVNAETHRVVVSNFVQSLLKMASTTKESSDMVGEQVRLIAQQQNTSASTTIMAMEKVQTRSKVQTFFLGADYKNLGTLRSETVQTRNRIEQLNRTMANMENASDTIEVKAQIQTLQQEQTRIEDFVKQNESKFSLFGWLTKLFAK
jgi:hypothetical protein